MASTGQGVLGYNTFSYCGNNPVARKDHSGNLWDYVLDWAFIAWGVHDVCQDPSVQNWMCLILDVGLAVAPFVPSGVGQIIKAADTAGDSLGVLNKVTVIGETMDRVKSFAKSYNALDNLYDGFQSYGKLAAKGTWGKIAAEIGGKISNASWLYGKLRSGYTVLDIGIDIYRNKRSSSYYLEQIVCTIWELRNGIKAIINYLSE